MQTLINATVKSLEQVSVIIDTVTDEHYQALNIGRHVRHIYDHLLAFERGYESKDVVDYNYRRRDHVLERSRTEAMDELSRHQHWFHSASIENTTIQIISEFDCRDMNSEVFQSFVARELLYLINHTIHHVAYLRLKLEQNGYTLPAIIGLAPATVSYQRMIDKQGEHITV